MSKTLRTAALVVGAVALVATGIGAAASIGAFGAIAAGSATAATLATIATVATVASVVGGVLSIAAAATASKPTATATGSPEQFSADPDAGIPLVLGRTGTAGNIGFRRGFDTRDAGDNDRQSFVSILSLGPVAAIEGMTVDKVPTFFGGTGAAIGAFAGFMWSMTQLGAIPEPAALSFGAGAGTPPGWTAQHKLSGLAAASWTLRFDTKAKVYQSGVPAPMWTVRGVLAYDPRKDSTYPGGSGPHRMADPSNTAAYDAAVATWEWTEDPYLMGLRWAHGFWLRDPSEPGSTYQRVMGMGAPWSGIDVAAFVEGANLSRANGWTVGGVVFSGDEKWATMKKILQAGMGEPLALGARISCLVNAPKVSLATITIDDVVGEASVAATQPRRDRFNTVTPRYRLEANNWQLLPGAPISVAKHVAEDRGKRSKVLDYPFIQNTPQIGTAVRYDIENAREFGPIVLPLKLLWMGYKPGDCVTANLPEVGLNNQPILLLNRDLDPSAGIATMTARSETPEKHAFALGQVATPPSTPGVSGPPLIPVPRDGAWTITDTAIASNGVTMPALVVRGQVDASTADSVVFEYRKFANGQAPDAGWLGAGVEPATSTGKAITGIEGGTQYEVAISYQRWGSVGARRIVGPTRSAAYEGVKGDSGQSAYTVILTNEAAVLPADSDGNILSYASAATTIQVFFGATDVTSSFAFGAGETNPQGLTGVTAFPNASFNGGFDAGERSASYTFKIIGTGDHEGVTLGKTITLTKSREAEDGKSPPIVDLVGSSSVFTYDAVDKPRDGLTTLTATPQNTTNAVEWRLLRWDGAAVTDWLAAPDFAAAGAATCHLDYLHIQIEEDNFQANLNYHGGTFLTYQVRVHGTDAADAFTVYKIRDGATGAAALSGFLTNESHTLTASAAGAVTDYSGAKGEFKVFLGTQDVTAQCAFAIAGASYNGGEFLAPINGSVYACTALLAPLDGAWVDYRATYNGTSITKRFTIAKTKVGADGKPAALITLTATGQACKFDASDNYVGEAIRFKAVHQGFNGNYAVRILRASNGALIGADNVDNFGANGGSYYTGSGVDTLVITPVGIANLLNAYGAIQIIAYSDGLAVTDSVTIYKVQDGKQGDRGLAGTTFFDHYAYAASSDGTVDFTTGEANGRGWEGYYQDTVEADSQVPGRYSWRRYDGPAFGMATRGACSVAGTTIAKSVASAADWNSDAYSTVGYKNGAVARARMDAFGNKMFGLNADPLTDASYGSLDFAWYGDGDVARIYENGSHIGAVFTGMGNYLHEVIYDGRYVKYMIGTDVYRTVDVGPGYTFYFDSSLYTPGCKLTDVSFVPLPAKGGNGVTLVADLAGTEISGNNVRCTNYVGWGAGHAHSKEAYSGGAVCTFTIPPDNIRGDTIDPGYVWFDGATDTMSGLSVETDDGSHSFGHIDFAIHRNSVGVVQCFSNGAPYGPAIKQVDPNMATTECRIHYDGATKVDYWVDGVLVMTQPQGTFTMPLYFATALASVNPRIYDVTLAPAGKRGNDGESTLAAYLTNETFNVQANNDGTYALSNLYTVSAGQMRVFLGSTEVTAQCTFTHQDPFWLASSIDAVGNYRGESLGNDTGYAYLIATYNGRSITKTLTGTKTRAGGTGAAALDIAITADKQNARFDKNQNYVGGTITFTTTRKNTGETPNFRFEGLDGTGLLEANAQGLVNYSPGNFSTTGIDNLTVSAAQVYQLLAAGGGGFVVIGKLVSVGIQDKVSVIRVDDGKDGNPGTPGAAAVSFELSLSSVLISADAGGVTKAGQLPKGFKATVRQGSVDVSSSATFSLSATDGISANISADGSGAVTVANAGGYIDVGAQLNGVALGTKRISIVRSLDNPPPASQTSGSGDIDNASISATTFQQVGPGVVLKASGGGQLATSLYASYSVSGGSGANVTITANATMAWRVPNGAWNYPSEANGSAAQIVGGSDSSEGAVNYSFTVTGLTAGAAYEVAPFMRKRTGSANAVATIYGQYAVTQ